VNYWSPTANASSPVQSVRVPLLRNFDRCLKFLFRRFTEREFDETLGDVDA
jgi:hypothetical protein